MTTWDLDIRRGWRTGLIILVVLILLAASLSVFAALNPVSLLTFVFGLGGFFLLCGAALLGYWLWSLVNAAYVMDRNQILIQWGSYEHQIPMAEIREVLRGPQLEAVTHRRVMHWPGYHVGWGAAANTGPIHFYATAPLDRQIILCLENMAYAISPADPENFLTALQERLEMGSTQEIEAVSTHPAFFDWPIWQDRKALGLLGIGGLLLLLLVALLTWRYPALPHQITLQISAAGEPLLITDAARIFYLVLIGALFLILNGGLGLLFYRKQAMLAYFLWGGTLVLQAALWVASLSVLLTL